jgi:hypothetical protein
LIGVTARFWGKRDIFRKGDGPSKNEFIGTRIFLEKKEGVLSLGAVQRKTPCTRIQAPSGPLVDRLVEIQISQSIAPRELQSTASRPSKQTSYKAV